MDLTEEIKNNIATEILQLITDGITKKMFDDATGKEIAAVAFEEIKKLRTQEDIPQLYKKLDARWPIFHHMVVLSEGEIDQKEEQEVIQGVAELISLGKIDDALKLAKSETKDEEIDK